MIDHTTLIDRHMAELRERARGWYRDPVILEQLRRAMLAEQERYAKGWLVEGGPVHLRQSGYRHIGRYLRPETPNDVHRVLVAWDDGTETHEFWTDLEHTICLWPQERPLDWPHDEIGAGEAAAILGVKPDTLRSYVARGHLRPSRALNPTTNLYERAAIHRLRDDPPRNGRPLATAPARTPTLRRLVRAQIAAQIAARGLSDVEAHAANIAEGWTVTTPGGPVHGYRWTRGEWAVLARLVAESRTARLPGDDVPF